MNIANYKNNLKNSSEDIISILLDHEVKVEIIDISEQSSFYDKNNSIRLREKLLGVKLIDENSNRIRVFTAIDNKLAIYFGDLMMGNNGKSIPNQIDDLCECGCGNLMSNVFKVEGTMEEYQSDITLCNFENEVLKCFGKDYVSFKMVVNILGLYVGEINAAIEKGLIEK